MTQNPLVLGLTVLVLALTFTFALAVGAPMTAGGCIAAGALLVGLWLLE